VTIVWQTFVSSPCWCECKISVWATCGTIARRLRVGSTFTDRGQRCKAPFTMAQCSPNNMAILAI